MLTVVLYLLNEDSPFESFKILSGVAKVEQEEYYIYFNRGNENEKIVNIKEIEKYEIYGSGCLVKSVDFTQNNMQ
ncbi:hypothetical protein CP985_13625 [Malaciobacter mytili LMG 24559]|uniref:Uncharacterized protein n=1 Tax=Malaciobacter mytili LMG 24559 TaxID=1032238 RepID=A0AAX2AG61_9BACT|nr:hypothetical protein [Malaciobacter mytili]AXH16448.1 hypothetical protein AMYT_a0150 [Malaciobacter mytili LMG 24559]RXK12990.1 hypothetical protein CP985_13625 [Malaciobacter mytili LMG 24559]